MLLCLAQEFSDNRAQYTTHLFIDDDTFPNNAKLEVVFYTNAFHGEPEVSPDIIEKVFCQNNWLNSWRNGLYPMHHYHSSAHEVLGIYSGWVKAQLGGPQGLVVVAKAGDVLIIPAGVAHKSVDQASDFRVIGAYPKGQSWDMNFGKEGERPYTDKCIQMLPLPKNDPVFGDTGPLMQIWK